MSGMGHALETVDGMVNMGLTMGATIFVIVAFIGIWFYLKR